MQVQPVPVPAGHHLGNGKYGGLRGFGPTVHPSRHFSEAEEILKTVPLTLPTSVDLSAILPKAYLDQGQVGRCGPFAFSRFRSSLSLKAGHPLQEFDPDDLYYQWRLLVEPQAINQDTGIDNTSMAGVVESFGVPLLADGSPLDPTLDVTPLSWASKFHAHYYANVKMFQLQTPTDFIMCLAAGYPFVFGFSVLDSIWGIQGTAGRVPDTGNVIGGHDIVAYKYDPNPSGTGRLITCRNQWGGFTINDDLIFDETYFTNPAMVSDCWTGWLNTSPAPNV